MIKKLLGIAPQPTNDGAFEPSPVALKLATSSKTDYQAEYFPDPYQGGQKILMLCTEQGHMTMANGKKFATGNHPVEMLVPMLHLQNAGFDIEVYTPTGKPVQIETWAMPEEDQAVMRLYHDYKDKLERPNSLEEYVHGPMRNSDHYLAVFIPGGHGAMLGLPDSPVVGALLAWAQQKDWFVLSICHGPAALLATANEAGGFEFDGYQITAFPDATDKQTPLVGYMPGKMPWYFGEKLKEYGVTIVNSKPDDSCRVDRKLITAASPKAADRFGKLCAQELLEHENKKLLA